MKKDDIGNRMKENYENVSRIYLTRRTPVIIRLDGKAFHSFTKGFDKPYDMDMVRAMYDTMDWLVDNIQGCKMGYCQSDEISLLIIDFDTLQTDAPFRYNLQKLVSISAAMASTVFNNWFSHTIADKRQGRLPIFDSRAFNIPREEVCNYFIWRQQDCIRNSISSLAQCRFSHKQLHKKNSAVMQDMLHEVGVNWNDMPNFYKNGSIRIFNKVSDEEIEAAPTFTQNRNVVEDLLKPREE